MKCGRRPEPSESGPVVLVASAVASKDRSDDAGGSLLSGLIAPLRVPERVLDVLAQAAGALTEMRSDLSAVREQTAPLAAVTKDIKGQVEPMPATIERISRQAEPLETVLPALEHLERAVVERLEAAHETMKALERDQACLNERVEGLGGEIVALHETVSGLKADVERVTERLPDPARGPLEKARDLLGGSGDSGAGGGS